MVCKLVVDAKAVVKKVRATFVVAKHNVLSVITVDNAIVVKPLSILTTPFYLFNYLEYR